MAYIYVDPTAAGDATGINIAGECYSLVGNNYSLSPTVTSIQGTSDGCPCNTSWACTNCLGQCFAEAATVTLEWSFDTPSFLSGADPYCITAFEAIQSGSATFPYLVYYPGEFPANSPIWANDSSGVTSPAIAAAYDCSSMTWSFQISQNIPHGGDNCGNTIIGRGDPLEIPGPDWVAGDSCGAPDDGNGASFGGPECYFHGNPTVACPSGALTGTFSITVNNNTDCCYNADAPGGAVCQPDVGAPCPSPDCS